MIYKTLLYSIKVRKCMYGSIIGRISSSKETQNENYKLYSCGSILCFAYTALCEWQIPLGPSYRQLKLII